MEKFLGIVLIIVFSLWALRYIGKLVLPFILKKLMQKVAEKSFNQNFGGGFNSYYNQQQPSGNEGDVHVTGEPPKSKSKGIKDTGEYVDFEEVDDSKNA